jgi:hypothetical protein
MDRRGDVTANEWHEVLTLLGQRWPNWTPTEAEREDIRRILAEERRKDVEECLFRVRLRYASDRPKLKWFLDAMGEVTDERQPPPLTACQKQARYYQELDEQRPAYDDDAADTLQRLRAMPRDELLACRDEFIEHTSMGKVFSRHQGSDDPTDWGPFFCGLLYARITIMEESDGQGANGIGSQLSAVRSHARRPPATGEAASAGGSEAVHDRRPAEVHAPELPGDR